MEGQMASARYPPHILPIVPCSVALPCDLGFSTTDSTHVSRHPVTARG